jgi:hypothetical protein
MDNQPQTDMEKAKEVFAFISGESAPDASECISSIAAALREVRKETEEELICEDCGYAGSSVKLNRAEILEEGRKAGLAEADQTAHYRHNLNEICLKCFAKGKNAGMEEAAKMADLHVNCMSMECVEDDLGCIGVLANEFRAAKERDKA